MALRNFAQTHAAVSILPGGNESPAFAFRGQAFAFALEVSIEVGKAFPEGF